MLPFLKCVANAYASRYDDLSGFCFVFPNKRSGTFFLKYLRQCSARPRLAPHVTTISDFVCRVGDSIVDNRISALFTLFNCYRDLLPPDAPLEFDSFRSWGETVLSDFNEVGMNCNDPDALFANLRDHKEIATDFLTDEQKKIMEEYFGAHAISGSDVSFWKHFNRHEEGDSEGAKGKKPLRKRFLQLWETLAPLYVAFHKALEQRGTTTSAGSYRRAVARLKECGREAVEAQKVVMVGFNALTGIELQLFNALRELGHAEGTAHPEDAFADFMWDATGPVFSEGGSKFVSANRRRFPEPQWARGEMAKSETTELPASLEVLSAPSNVIQAKLTADRVTELYHELGEKKFANARVGVVLPDENLLIPFLYAIPDEIQDVNLTMGYSLKLTSVMSFVAQLKALLHTSRVKDGTLIFYAPDLRSFLSHPFTRLTGGVGATESLERYAENLHKITLTLDEVITHVPALGFFRSLPPADCLPGAMIHWLDELLDKADEALAERDHSSGVRLISTALDTSHIAIYRQGLRCLEASVKEFGIVMHRDTVLAMTQRMLSSQRVQFEGEPLKGLQVMGLLETRSIDFDYVVIPSLNERILPLRSRTRTFIPNALRSAYGLPPANYAEELFSYYFYRLISRAKKVIMIYDGRSGAGMRAGGPSRYIYQLRHLYASDRLKTEECRFSLGDNSQVALPIAKSAPVREALLRFVLPDGADPNKADRRLSATAINDYIRCQKLFFFKHVVRLKEPRQASVHIDQIQLGNIVHRLIQSCYTPAPGASSLRVDRSLIMTYLGNPDLIYTMANNAMIAELPHLKTLKAMPGDYAIVRDAVINMAKGILRTDLQLAEESKEGFFTLLGSEVAADTILTSASGRKMAFRYAIDRADYAGGSLRIVDYKTGRIHATGSGLDEMFCHGSTSMSNALQLMIYAGIARDLWPLTPPGSSEKEQENASSKGVEMVLYKVTSMSSDNPGRDKGIIHPQFIPPVSTGQKKEEIPGDAEIREEFDTLLAACLDSIIDSPAFYPTPDTSKCTYCAFASICTE